MVTENGQSDGNTSFLRAARNGQLDKVLEHLKSNIDINTSNANGLNALHLASKDGHVDIVEELLKRGAVVDAATKKGNTALHIASLAGQEEVVKLLVQHGASVNVQSQNGFTPLYMAAQENHDNVVKYLLSNGANQSLSTEDGFTPLAVAMQQGHDKVVTVLLENDTRGKVRLPALHIAAKKDDVKAAKLLLENEHNPDVTSKSGFTPLHIASHYGNQQIANLLIQKGADVNYAAKHNITPLHVAAKWGKTNMVATLLEHGATIEAKTRDGLTPLHCAARSGHEQVVDMLLERGAPISSKTKNGLAPLHMAAQGDHVDAARILLYHRAPVDEVTVDYLTALHVAAHCGHVRVAKLLLDRQADANARALNGFTPLHIACKKNRIKVVELLLKHGASIGATTESGLTPLHVASFMGCMNIVIYLLQHDANPDVPTIRGETPLHLAARANQTDIIRILLRNGAQVDARAREQQTPLHIASRLGNVDIVMLLLQHGAKVDSATKDMYTALHIAAKEGQDEVAGVLIDNGASINSTTKKGFTPLHLASKYGHLKVAKLLLQKEAPVDAQGKNGVTPLHVASHYDHQNVALLLLDKGASPHAAAKNGHTPLHIAARKNQMDIANTLLEYGALPNSESKAGFTPLHLSAQEGHPDMTSLLIEHKANTNHESKNGLAPLHLCAQEDRVPVAEILVKNGANTNAATKAGYTPLHIACHYGQANMVRFLLQNGANVESATSLGYTPLHQAAQQGHTNIVNILLEKGADPNAETTNGQTPLSIAQKLGYITVIETLKNVTTTPSSTNGEEKYRVQAPEAMQETFLSDSEEEGGEDTVLGDHTYRYLTADEMKSLGDDSLPIDVTRDERIDSNRMISSMDSNMLPPQHFEDTISPEHVANNYVEYIKKYTPDNVDIARHPISHGKLHWKNFLVSFLVDARGGAMRGCRHSGVRVIVPPRCAPSPTRITCRYVRPQRTPHPPPLMEGEALASRVLELGPVGAKFLGPVIIEVPHFAALRGKEREIVILRSDNGDSWKEHTVEAAEEILNDVLHDSFEAEDLNQLEDISSGRITRIITQDFPQYFAVVSRVRQEVHAIGPEGGMVSSTVVPQVQAIFPEGALTKKIKVGLQAQPIDPELTAKLLGHGVAVSPVVTVEPRRRKFHKAIRLNMPAPTAHSQGMINQYSGSAPTLRLLCSITGGTTRAQWEDVTGSTPLTFVNDVVSFTTTVSARFWLMDCRNIGDATKMATELYKEAIHVPFMAKFVVFAKRVDPLEARLRVFCMTDDKEDKTLEHQEHFTEVAKSRDVEVLEGKPQYIEFSGNLVPITKSGEQLQFSFRAFRENRLPFSVRVKDQHAEAVGRCLFMKEAKVQKGEPPQQPICILNIVLPDDIVTDTISLTDSDSVKRHMFLSESYDYYRPDPRLADMSNLLGDDWVELAHQLGLTSSEINVIKSEYPESTAKQAQSMLRMWLSQSGNKAQTNTLENALKRIGREDIIPQCLNVEQSHTVTRIKHEEIGYRLSSKETKKEKKEEPRIDKNRIEGFDKYSAEEKVVEKSESEEEDYDKTVPELREQIEKRLSAERAIPASAQRKEIVQEITTIKQQTLVEDKLEEIQQKETDVKLISPEKPLVSEPTVPKTTVKLTKPVESEINVEKTTTHKVSSSDETKDKTTHKTITTTTTTTTRTTTDHPGTDLLEGVTQHFEVAKKVGPKIIAEEDLKSPKFSKTPPPSPADFLFKDQHQATTVQGWDATGKPEIPKETTVETSPAQQEPSCGLTTIEAESPLTQNIPQPTPRSVKPPVDMPLDLSSNIIETKQEKVVSPVRDDLLDEDDDFGTYSDKKKFWENVTKESAHKRMSVHEVSLTEREAIISKKRSSVHELGITSVHPVPKPRSVLQSSQSVLIEEKKNALISAAKDKAMSFDSTASDSTDRQETELSRLSEGEVFEEKIMTEYQASFMPPSNRADAKKVSVSSRPESTSDLLIRDDSLDSDKAQQGSSHIENTGYISDSEDVENVISDSEIEDRVPQIRERQMSVFAPLPAQRKTIYERSSSLPTEDLYEVSARSIKLRKEYYEQQIKKEMIEEQYIAENEEDTSPERKTLASLQEEKLESYVEKKDFSEQLPSTSENVEQSEEHQKISKTSSVEALTKSFEIMSTKPEKESTKEIFRIEKKEKPTDIRTATPIEMTNETEKMSVKDLAKDFEKQLGSVVAGQKIGQSPIELKGFVLDKDKTDSVKESKAYIHKEDIDSDSYGKSQDEFSISQQSTDEQKRLKEKMHKSFESQLSLSSEKSGDICEDINARDDSLVSKPDSMEVHVDKSEIEDSEKLAELEQETDCEIKSLDSLNAESSPKNFVDDIPEITVTLSGKQRRISEESDEYSDKSVQPISPILEKSEVQSPVKQPKEDVEDIVWEVSVQSERGFEEKVQEMSEHSRIKVTEEFIAIEKVEEQKEVFPISSGNDKDIEHLKENISEQLTKEITQQLHEKIKEKDISVEKAATEEVDDKNLDELKEELIEEAKGLLKSKSETKCVKFPSEEEDEDLQLEHMIKRRSTFSDTTEEEINIKPQDIKIEDKQHDDLSSSFKDESDMVSEIHLDSSDSVSEKIKSESQSDIEKIILDSLHSQKVDPEEARRIATALLGEIEAEIQKSEKLSPLQESMPIRPEVSDYLRHLAETKGLDQREVELVESVLARRQRELAKLARGDTQASSMEITDEDLRFSGAELDFSHTLEQQMDHLKAEQSHDLELEQEQNKKYHTKAVTTDLVDEAHSYEKVFTHDQEVFDGSKTVTCKKDVSVKTSDMIKGESMFTQDKNVIFEEDESITETAIEESSSKFLTHVVSDITEETVEKSEDFYKSELKKGMVKAESDQESKLILEQKEVHKKDNLIQEIEKSDTIEKSTSAVFGKYETDTISKEFDDNTTSVVTSKVEKEYDERNKKDQRFSREEICQKEQSDGITTETTVSVDKTHYTTSKSLTTTDKSHEERTHVTTKVTDETDVEFDKLQDIIPVDSGISIVTTHTLIQRTSSSDSKSSLDSTAKSPEEQFSTCSSEHKRDIHKTPEKQSVILRKSKSEVESSSSSSNLKPERKSGIEFETYSSSGESHYHSFEMDSGKSRPCSSDVEGLIIAAGSSEYESALTSQEYSARSYITSTDYQTAVSSLSSKESMKSLDSESSGNLASVEVSEHSETLVPSTSDLDGDILDLVDHQLLEDAEPTTGWAHMRQSTELSDSEMISGVGESIDMSEEEASDMKQTTDVQSKMKRSYEMTFQPEPKILAGDSQIDSHESEEKLGASLDDGSVLSMSMSSTSSTGAVKTVIELSRADSERLEGSMTVSGTSDHLSMDEIESTMRESRDSVSHTPVSIPITSDMSTSTTQPQSELPLESVTLTTSYVTENGIASVSTQVTSESQSPVENKALPFEKSVSEEPKKKGHRRTDSTTFVQPLSGISIAKKEIEKKIQSPVTESATTPERKEIYGKEEKDVTEKKAVDHGVEQKSQYVSESQSEFSKLDSAFSEDKLADLIKSAVKDKFEKSSEEFIADIEQDGSFPLSKSPEKRLSTSSISDVYPSKETLEKRDSHGKSSTTSSEKSSFEEAEAEAAFSMVAHISPAHKVKQICPILEDEDAEKHELELKEKAQKELEEKRAQIMKDVSPGYIPDITVTEHMTPLVDTGFRYPEMELAAMEKLQEEQEQKERYEQEMREQTPQTPASSKSSEDTSQGKEYVIEEVISKSIKSDSEITDSYSCVTSIVDTTIKEKETDSQSSDSFEMLEKPDIIDDFVVIEEVAKEAHEFDTEGKSVHISQKKASKSKHDQEVEKYLVRSAPTPLTKMTDYPDGTSSSEELGFDFEDSPPQAGESSKQSGSSRNAREYDKQLEENKKWIEQQFQGDAAAMMAAGYGYEMEFERGPLEDIKEEDINDFAASSYGSQKDSGGSLGSVKESYSSTPEYDVLAGRKYFTRSGENDDISMSSLQEFENLEKAMSLEMRRFHAGSQDSSSNGSFKNRYISNKSQGEEVSASSLKEFEGLEKACIAAHRVELKAREEEAMLGQIEEAQEGSIASESESCETVGTEKRQITDTDDDDDYEKRMFEIDEIIKQAQTNVERFIDLKEVEKTESLGRGDSVEEVSRVPDLELDAPLVRSTIKVQLKENEDVMVTSTDSLDLKPEKRTDSTDSLDQQATTAGDIMTASTDSIEFQAQKSKDNIMTDSIEVRDEKSYMVSSDSLELGQATSSGINLIQSDSIDDDGSRIVYQDRSSSSTGKDFSSSAREELLAEAEQHPKDDTESIDVTSSTATHATYQFETDSVFSGSFTSGGSNTMVSSTDTIDPMCTRETVDIGTAVKKVWFDEDLSGRRITEYTEEYSKPYVTEFVEPSDDEHFSHTFHRKVELPPEVHRITFTGKQSEEQMQKYLQDFNEGEEVQEFEETDEHGNVHTKRIVQKRFIIKDSGSAKFDEPIKEGDIEEYFRKLNKGEFDQKAGVSITRGTIKEGDGKEEHHIEYSQSQLTSLTSIAKGDEKTTDLQQPTSTTSQAESEESQDTQSDQSKKVADQHQLSDEMKELLKELEKESKQ